MCNLTKYKSNEVVLGDGLATESFAAWRGRLDLGVDLSPYQQAQPGQI